MTVLALDIERPSILGVRPRATGDGPTLDDVIAGAWEALSDHHSVSCPVCAGAMRPRYGAAATQVGGRCDDCGSALG